VVKLKPSARRAEKFGAQIARAVSADDGRQEFKAACSQRLKPDT
jgi:hypothetical protein